MQVFPPPPTFPCSGYEKFQKPIYLWKFKATFLMMSIAGRIKLLFPYLKQAWLNIQSKADGKISTGTESFLIEFAVKWD